MVRRVGQRRILEPCLEDAREGHDEERGQSLIESQTAQREGANLVAQTYERK